MNIQEYDKTLVNASVDDDLRKKLVNAYEQGVRETIREMTNFLSIHNSGTECGTKNIIITFPQEKYTIFTENLLKR